MACKDAEVGRSAESKRLRFLYSMQDSCEKRRDRNGGEEEKEAGEEEEEEEKEGEVGEEEIVTGK